MKTSDIRAAFLSFFARNHHEIVPSSSLVPHGDPTLMFTNAGMVQFKHIFLGHEQRTYKRAVSSQKCVRAGGKHNDLENVGQTARHHTFFEMLGNFSFGDYFKRDAIRFAWQFLTQELNIPANRLLVTVYHEDDEAAKFWLEDIGLQTKQLIYISTSDNFWSMGDTGPCGPCSEIFYDHGEHIAGGPPGSPEEDSDRFVEIWNLVFMQYDRDAEGVLTPLPKPCVDTGIGLERVAAVMQNLHNNYDTDLFRELIAAAEKISGTAYGQNDKQDMSLRVLADHLRSVSFLLADGVMPSNEGRGFVLRRILRRACRHGRLLGTKQAFMYQLVETLVDLMGEHFSELKAQQEHITRIVRIEEERFIKTLDKGLKLLDDAIEQLDASRTLAGQTLFTLYDTFGFPLDLTQDILRDTDIVLDVAGFNQCMQSQRERARSAWSGSGESSLPPAVFSLHEEHGATQFLGYESTQSEAVLLALLQGENLKVSLQEGEEAWLFCNQTPFYAESGGQVGDSGTITTPTGTFLVKKTIKTLPDLFAHVGVVQHGHIDVHQGASCRVEQPRRNQLCHNHTATHLLHEQLRVVLGDHVKQAGSLVNAERLRFDFNHMEPMSAAEKKDVEQRVNQIIWQNEALENQCMSQDDAIAQGAIALFGEKYGDEVRVVKAGTSVELCGGTHVKSLGDIGLFRLISEVGIASGVRRIEAITGFSAYQAMQQEQAQLHDIASQLRVNPLETVAKVQQLQDKLKSTEKELSALQAKQASSSLDDLITQATDCAGTKLLAMQIPPQEGVDLRDLMDKCKSKLKSGVIVLAIVRGEKVQLIAGVTKDLLKQFHAGNIIREIAKIVGGRGGGRPDMAQAGGTQPENVEKALAIIPSLMTTN
ncbi:MAG: alanine--tRNA ligase [Mariprofundaceae bacterium]|nr:alanine--tRNA ligase [Mariprofundaceae bacterium]